MQIELVPGIVAEMAVKSWKGVSLQAAVRFGQQFLSRRDKFTDCAFLNYK